LRIHHSSPSAPKGWFEGPWNSDLGLSLGFANEWINEPYLHSALTEIYLVASGTATVRVERGEVCLSRGDVVIIEPGEAHSFTQSSADYFHFVIHFPGLSGPAAAADKILVDPSRLGL
jgi:hypothetical protein